MFKKLIKMGEEINLVMPESKKQHFSYIQKQLKGDVPVV